MPDASVDIVSVALCMHVGSEQGHSALALSLACCMPLAACCTMAYFIRLPSCLPLASLYVCILCSPQVVCVYLFHELPEAIRRKAVAEMYRVLKPGGRCAHIHPLALHVRLPPPCLGMGIPLD